MTDIFKRLGLRPDTTPQEIASVLMLCYRLQSNETLLEETTALLLTAIEQRGERRMWEKMRKGCKWRKGTKDNYWCWEQGGESCDFDTCPLRKEGE